VKQRIFQQLQSLRTMRLEGEGSPDAVNTGAAQPAGFREGSGRPVRRVTGRRFQRQRQHAIHIGLAQFARRSRPWLVQQAVQTLFDKTLPPFANGLNSEMIVPPPFRCWTGQRRKSRITRARWAKAWGHLGLPGPCPERVTFTFGQKQRGYRTSESMGRSSESRRLKKRSRQTGSSFFLVAESFQNVIRAPSEISRGKVRLGCDEAERCGAADVRRGPPKEHRVRHVSASARN